MILYSKSGNFLGIGKDELSFLGYEDLDEFKSVCSDVADLFVNRPGYIFKFKNFSWIDYALHSGAPKKSVIIKLKTGNEVESIIKIKELFLYNPKENEELYYSIEFVNSLSQNTTLQNDSAFIQSTPAPQVPTSIKMDETPREEEVAQEQEIEAPKEISLEEDFVQEETEDLSVNFNSIQEEEKPTPKLKIDNTVFEKEDETESTIDISDDFTQDFESEEPPKLKIDITPEEESFEQTIDISSDYEEVKEDVPTFETPNEISFTSNIEIEDEQEESVDFDLVQCVEELGLDISLVGELITDYMDKIDQSIPDIKTSIKDGDEALLKHSVYKLKGISDNLHMTQLSNKLGKILESTDEDTRMKELERFEKIVAKFRGELI
jgi:hypothetical protein